MTRKDYVKFADMFKEAEKDITPMTDSVSGVDAVHDIVTRAADIFEADNPNFQRFKFYNACTPD